jgi:hypothetical protein
VSARDFRIPTRKGKISLLSIAHIVSKHLYRRYIGAGKMDFVEGSLWKQKKTMTGFKWKKRWIRADKNRLIQWHVSAYYLLRPILFEFIDFDK